MAITLTPEALARAAYAAYAGVFNIRKPYVADRKAMPAYAMFERMETTAPLAVGALGGVQLKYKTQSNLAIQGWERKDALQFAEQNIELQTSFPWSNVHQGMEMVHDDLEALGFIVLPNQPRGKMFAKADSKSDAVRMVDYLKEAIESMEDKFDVSMDQILLRDNSATPKLPQGFDNYWPVGVAPGMVSDADGIRGYYNLGSVGGKLRSAYPDVLQHFLWLGATWGAAGSLRTALTTAKREAQLRSRGRSKGGIRAILAGSRALDKYVKFAVANNTNYTQSVTVLNNGGLSKLDLGIADTGLHFEGTPIVHCPTFEVLDQLDAPAYAWTDRMVLVDTDSLALAYAPGKKKLFSAPMDDATTRVTNLSLDSKLVMLPKILNANTIVTLA